MKRPVYHGHLDALTLQEIVESGTWLTVNLVRGQCVCGDPGCEWDCAAGAGQVMKR